MESSQKPSKPFKGSQPRAKSLVKALEEKQKGCKCSQARSASAWLQAQTQEHPKPAGSAQLSTKPSARGGGNRNLSGQEAPAGPAGNKAQEKEWPGAAGTLPRLLGLRSTSTSSSVLHRPLQAEEIKPSPGTHLQPASSSALPQASSLPGGAGRGCCPHPSDTQGRIRKSLSQERLRFRNPTPL